MTRKFPSAKSPMEELDLDSFLRRHNANSGEDDDADEINAGVPHRTVDDILNDSDSSSSSPPSTRISLSLSSSNADHPPPKTLNSTQSKYSLVQRFKSDEFAGRKPPPRPSSSLFGGGVRPAARPGTALAAAAAASRSVSARHAAGMKSRRALSVSLEGKVPDGDELLGFSRDDFSDDRISISDQVDVKSEDGNGDYVHERVEESIQERDSDSASVESEVVVSNEDPSMSNSNGEVVDQLSNEKSSISMSDELENAVDEHSADMGAGSLSEVESEKMEAILESEVSVAKDDSSSISDDDDDDVDELIEDRIAQLESEIATRMTQKEVEPLKKKLELAEELEIKQASTGFHLEEGAAAQPMRLEGVRRGSTVLGYFDTDADNMITRTIKSQTFRRDYGIPQVLCVHLNYIALGTSKGAIVVLPCKYTPHHPDNMDAKILMLGAQGDRSQVPVTSICFNQQGDLLLAGYGDGHITVWNIPRGTVVKAISGEHKAPVVHALFLGQDSQVTRQFKAVTGDCKGLVKLHEFSGMTFLGFTVKTQCLLDGQKTGTVICASPLLPDECTGAASATYQGNATGSSGSIGGMMGGVVGGAGWKLFSEGSSLSEEGVVIFVTHQSALVVRLSPSLEVYASLPKPEGVREGAMPYTAWKCTTQTCGSSTEIRNPDTLEKISLLAIAWDRKIQVAKLVKSELKVCGMWTVESSAIGLAWLDDQMLVILTLAGQLCLFTKEGTLIHQTSYALYGFGGDDLIAYHTYFTNVFGNPEKAYHNSIAVRGASVYILGPMHAIVSRLLPWKERIQVLRKGGDWMGALNMAMTLYDGQAHGVIDLPRDLHAVQDAIMPYLVELLFSYVDESFSYISVACFSQTEKVEKLDNPKSNSCVKTEIKEQFTRVGGVAVEFCIHIKRTDILFDDIFSKFVAVQHKDTFLELLEPYILKDMLGSLPPEIMQALVEHYNSKGWLQRVEQCVLHMDISSLDFNQVVRLCRENGLYGALIYLFNKGLDDFKTPLEELLSVLRNNEKDAAAAANVGYRMLVYLKYCFSGLAFPPGHGTLSSERLPSLRMELVQFLLEESGGPKSQTAASLTSTGAYLNLHYLLEMDTEATLDVLRISFREYGNFKPESSLPDSSDQTTDNAKDSDQSNENQDMMVQKTVDALVLILDVNISQSIRSAGTDDTGLQVWPSKKDIGHLIEFIASYVASRRANVSKSVLSQIMEYLISDHCLLPNGSDEKNESRKRREKKVLALLDAVRHTEWNPSYVLHLCEDVQFYQVCGLIHTIRHQYVAALDSYIKDVNEPVHAFSFIHSMLLQLSGTESAAFRSAVISRISELLHLSRECTFYLVIDHFNKERGHILSELRSKPQSLFLYLKTLVEVHLSGTLNFSCVRADNIVDVPCGGRVKDGQTKLEAYLGRISEFPKVLRNNPVEVTNDMIELYLELLCQYEPDSVLKFLDTFENYRVDRCLQLCQEYGIVDAAAFLLERVGDVGTALLLTLSSINDKFIMLDTAVRNVVSARAGRKNAHVDYVAAASGLKEVQDIRKILRPCVGLCQRNTPRLDPEESESLWFHLLDSFCKPLIVPDQNSETGIFAQSLSSKNDQEVNAVTWRISGSHKHAPVLKALFSQFVKEIVEGMIGYVRLPSIMEKLLSDNGSREFGDFKLTILGMLGTYGFEMRILDTARSLIEDDTYYTMSVLKKGASKGYAPRSLVCCVCNCPFNKSSSSSGIRLFNCGHSTHLQCDTQEIGTSSRSSSGGCPICVHKQKIQKTKGKIAEQGLVSTTPSRSTRAQATSMHQHELDPFENSASHQISRFEILNSLQKNQRLIQTDTMPQLRLAPPAVYHEKVNKRDHFSSGSSSGGLMDAEKHSKNRHLRDLKVKGSSIRFPLKSKIFGKEKTRLQ